VRRNLDTSAIASGLDTCMDKVLEKRAIAVEEEVISGAHAAHGEVEAKSADGGVSEIDETILAAFALADGEPQGVKIEILESEFLEFAEAEASVPEEVEGGAVEQGISPLTRGASEGEAALDVVTDEGNLFVCKEPGKSVGLLEAADVEECERDGVSLVLQMDEQSVEGTQVLIDGAGGVPGLKAVIDVVEDLLPGDVRQGGDGIVLEEPVPEAGVGAPEASDLLVDASGTPVDLTESLEALQLVNEPERKASGVTLMRDGLESDIGAAALLAEEAAELIESIAVEAGTNWAELLSLDVVECTFEVRIDVEERMRLEV